MYRHSLRTRVAIAFAVCVAVLSVAWGFAFFAAIRFTEDRVLQHQLQRAAESYPSMPMNLRGYDEIGSLPESLREWAQTNPDEGLYEFENIELHVAVVATGDEQQHGFVVFDVTGIEAASSEDWWWLLFITGAVGALATLGFGLGVVVMRKAVAPVAQLAKAVADIDPEQLTAEDHKRIDSSRFGDDEVGVLARTIEKTLERISAFVERERFFTSSASHELRTPITVITGALELLEQSDLSAADVKVVDRVRRATLDMKTTIEMFLCLARETDDGLYDEQFLVMPLVSKAIDQQRYLLTRKLIDVDIDELAKPRVNGHPQAFSIAVNNLVRNAFEHTLHAHGPITIRVKEHELLVTNQVSSDADNRHTPTEAPPSQGYGLGLGIVQRLCERNGWSFSLLADEKRVVARLSW
ncbi:HAMP domain-containing histidine kinase [Halomonas sp. FeN2]|jgi:signal transduction histidine kinase|uniref:histidine kinase n=1 Tax=Halomonas campaniensis TaxID=213554 RepID=A0A246RX62_9GAMM|nr:MULTISPECIES: HAMP domain-containing sensor histidine kinase [Halomonas]MBF59695.1 sensor histidine kinase [Halomonas sp.]MBS3666367.1 HAMP domain-containing histidine kinase [Halomonas boliviensis]OWV28754.1 histidine kinase [Halomonas campaniensis]UBR48815.1 HAMP domain-containing histidine kinase [Halomonas sp. FeN2]|tara:strand:+ start:12130 stop:13362 length:1233 start_codon:yes stop_codon:yes gene_type:complete